MQPAQDSEDSTTCYGYLPVDDQRDISRLITRIQLLAFPFLTFFSVRAYMADAIFQGVVLNVFSVLLLANTGLFLKRGGHERYKWSFIAIIICLFIYLVLDSVEGGTGILWLYAFPPLVFYISELRTGSFFCAFGVVAVLAAFTPLGVQLGVTDYPMSFKLAFLTSFIFEMGFCYTLDKGRRTSREQLINLARHFEYAAKHDSLTGLYNRREGGARLTGEYSRFQRHGNQFSILLLDIDLFKRINDTWGHEAGDLIIRQVANSLTHLSRKSDVVARWGGEEFLIILPEAGSDDAVQMAQRIREHVAAGRVRYQNQQLSVTTSIGVATIQANEALDNLLRRADENLYAAKSGGRNMVVV